MQWHVIMLKFLYHNVSITVVIRIPVTSGMMECNVTAVMFCVTRHEVSRTRHNTEHGLARSQLFTLNIRAAQKRVAFTSAAWSHSYLFVLQLSMLMSRGCGVIVSSVSSRARNEPSTNFSQLREGTPTRALSWLKAPTRAFTFKTLFYGR